MLGIPYVDLLLDIIDVGLLIDRKELGDEFYVYIYAREKNCIFKFQMSKARTGSDNISFECFLFFLLFKEALGVCSLLHR